MWRTGLVASRHVGSSSTRDGNHVPRIVGRRILNHWAIREVPSLILFHLPSFTGPDLPHGAITPLKVLCGPFGQLLGKPDPTTQGTVLHLSLQTRASACPVGLDQGVWFLPWRAREAMPKRRQDCGRLSPQQLGDTLAAGPGVP